MSSSLVIVEGYYSLNGTISAVYLLDVPPELVFAIAVFCYFP